MVETAGILLHCFDGKTTEHSVHNEIIHAHTTTEKIIVIQLLLIGSTVTESKGNIIIMIFKKKLISLVKDIKILS